MVILAKAAQQDSSHNNQDYQIESLGDGNVTIIEGNQIKGREIVSKWN